MNAQSTQISGKKPIPIAIDSNTSYIDVDTIDQLVFLVTNFRIY